MNQVRVPLCTAKFHERFAMLIPKVPIHSNIRQLPEGFVPAVRLKCRLRMNMCSTDSVCSSRAPTQNSSNPTLLQLDGKMLRKPPTVQTTNARPCFDVRSIDKHVHRNIPLMNYCVPFKCPICARQGAYN